MKQPAGGPTGKDNMKSICEKILRKKEDLEENIPHTGDKASLDQCG